MIEEQQIPDEPEFITDQNDEVQTGEDTAPDAKPAPTPETPPTPEWSEDDEIEARAFGWKPAEEWQGDHPPKGLIQNPRDYMDRARSFGPFRMMQDKLDKLERITSKQIERAEQKARDEERQKYEAQLRNINARQRQAVEEADTDTWERLERQKATIQPPQEAPQQPKQPQQDVAEQFPDKQWLRDPIIRSSGAQAIEAAIQAGQLSRSASPEEQVAYAEKALHAYFPHLFGGEKPKPKPSPVDGGSLAGGPRKRAGFDALPADAKATFASLVNKGIFKDTEADRKFYHDEYNNA